MGAVKTNIGHLESAAGVASLAKVVLALAHDKLPPSINYAGPNPHIDFDAVHLKVLDTIGDWPRYSGYAIAGVSSFGFGGTNAHMVLREVLPRDVVERDEPESEAEVAQPNGQAETQTPAGRFDEFGGFIEEHPPDSTNPRCLG
ncbi:beta-ketoacyl synthase, C-terminal domain protein [Mycobacterium xenopi 4042]|uniref:Beta-ketoacyl synthase, C-terminal domain protein n=1 Tax=Mycobacterium xenopi 4042 TaxID=1299334 RepID=X8DK04_MYCXE|nr:beta-ketoacyl synthase, C-terminal domain protein [Mycobacterium xenopi 4042]